MHFTGAHVRPKAAAVSNSLHDASSLSQPSPSKASFSADVLRDDDDPVELTPPIVHWLTHYFEHNADLHDDDLILFTDAWDVVIQRDLREFTAVFLAQTNHQRGVIFIGEPGCADSFTLPGDLVGSFVGIHGDQLRHGAFTVQLDSTYPERTIQGDNMCNMIAAKTSMNSTILRSTPGATRRISKRTRRPNLRGTAEFRLFCTFQEGYKYLYATCAPKMELAVRADAPGKYMFDVHRQINVLVSSVCPTYS
ncbi:hypothetical protein DYB28_006076 [Aphanomyces astaci]|uniref:Uncharacterized protein n=1 Tax=Aphanomyces astaci TaxID=112090 RepID=A0A9X8HB50_APHAT|nr:hypothetical protein DYB28_006076 [Aphanomyces astaci]